MSLTPSEMALIGACAHNHARKIDESGFNPDWLPNPYVRDVLNAYFTLSRKGKVTNMLNVMILARKVPKEEWPAIQNIMLNGYGDVDPQAAMDSAKHDYMIEQSRLIARQMAELADTNPADVEKWLATQTSKAVSLIREGQTYDPRPSVHLSKPVPKVTFRSLCEPMNDTMRGGYRSYAFFLWAGLNKQGKTTNAISATVDALLQGKKVAYVNTENAEQVATHSILYALSGITAIEVETGVFLNPDREASYERWKTLLDELLEVYDFHWLNDSRLQRIATWSKPALMVIDYLKRIPGRMFVTGRHDDEVGDMGDFIANELCAGLGMCVLASGQVSGDAMHKLMKKDLPSEPFILYGSKRAIDPASIYGLIKRSREPNIARFFVWHDRLDARMNTSHDIPFNPFRKIWMLEPHQKHIMEHV